MPCCWVVRARRCQSVSLRMAATWRGRSPRSRQPAGRSPSPAGFDPCRAGAPTAWKRLHQCRAAPCTSMPDQGAPSTVDCCSASQACRRTAARAVRVALVDQAVTRGLCCAGRLWHRAARGRSLGLGVERWFGWAGVGTRGDSSHTMTCRIGPRGWLIVVLCAATGVAVTVTVPGSGAGAARVTAACDTASHGVRTGWQHLHDPKRSRPKWQLLCAPSSPVPSTGESAPMPAPSLTRIPADQMTLTLTAGQPDPPPPTPATPTGPPSEHRHEVEVAANSTTAVGGSLVLLGLVLAFIVGVSGLVFAAGRRRGGRAD